MGSLRGSFILNNMVWLFYGSRSLDSSWSWVVCFSAAVTSAVYFGFTLSFGVLFPELMSYFNETVERTAFVGSAALGMTWFASPPVGYFIDRFGCRIASFLGGLLCIVGLLSTSFVQSLSYMYFTYSLVFGVGGCFLYNSCYLVIARYFKRNLSLATGIVAMGTSLGLIFQGPLLQCLLDSCGWRATVRVITIFFALVCILSLTYNPNIDETPGEENVNNSINNEDDSPMNSKKIVIYCSVWLFPTYAFVVISFMFGSFGIYVPFIYLIKYCETVGISAQKASRLFIFVGLSSSFGRLISGKLCNADRVNAVFIYQSSLLLAAICAFLLPFATKYREVIAFSVVYGLADGIFITTHGFILLSCIDAKRRTAAFAMNNVLFAIAAAAGGPIIGLIVDKTGNYIYSFYMTSGMLFTGFLIPMVLVILRRRRSRVGIVESKQVCEPDRKLANNIETQEVDSNSNGGHRTIQPECTA
ncbi:PREDICTED: monocarboxylate transporter 10-like [Acropora digitifera]|uniref:monocarboxylate transporter 10-like n=1 Tax=Acropora digitifera TaxID=70779 RepID=UPI000779F4F2|nr:PREDICTED: monocarboxylate transporter 10-like [Acropora digitifera]XP_015770802.1 PREDICTED: monocarboxylate transporter 10-like [Acropora digitifera]